ncbi:MAG: transporter [Luteolibacter sp.]
MRFLVSGILSIFIPVSIATAGPFTVSSPNATSVTKLKIGTELKDGETKDTLTLPKIEIKTPIARNLDLAFIVSHKSIDRDGQASENGIGDFEIKSKWNFYRNGNFGMAIEPLIVFPTGDERRGLGNGDFLFEFPLIFGFKTGNWEWGTELGFEHVLHQDEDNAYCGILAMRRLTPNLRIGAEIVAEFPDVRFDSCDTLADIGLKWTFCERCELQALAGRTLRTADHGASNKFKLALEIKF